MIRPRDFFKVEATTEQDIFVILELTVNPQLHSTHKYRWMYVTNDYPSAVYDHARRFSWRETIDFLNTVDVNSEPIDL